jgi:hypothetical protein
MPRDGPQDNGLSLKKTFLFAIAKNLSPFSAISTHDILKWTYHTRNGKIIAHLKLIFMAERPPPSQFVQKELLMAAEERGEYH